jgi:hypothetical protein
MMSHTKFNIKRPFWGILLCAFCAVAPLPAQISPVSQIEDDSALRAAIHDAWFAESPARVLRNAPFIRVLPGGASVQVRAQARRNECTVYLARRWEGRYPGWGPGSWLLTRRMTGEYERIRVFLNNDPNAYIQFRPAENGAESGKSVLDVVIYEAYVVRGLTVGIPFKQLLVMPLNEVLSTLGHRVPLRYFQPESASYRDIRALLAAVREALPGLRFNDDGALDENGRYVYIKDGRPQNENGAGGGLNCSGFTKWFVDGILYPVTGRRLGIDALKKRTEPDSSSLTENYAGSRDPWFGLDWTRNLAMEAFNVLRKPSVAAVRDIEIRDSGFGALIDRERSGEAAGAAISRVRGYPAWLPNAGFGVEGLKPLLYTLAVNEPGYVYLASCSAERGPNPRIRQHYHDAVLVPWFNEYGVFQTAVFESAEETSLTRFTSIHAGEQINLVRIPVENRFHADN